MTHLSVHSFWGDINFVSTTTGQPFHVRATANCKTSNVIYLIECRRCKKKYEGKTQNLLHIHLNVHCSGIKNKRTEKILAAHFNTMRDLTILVIETVILVSKRRGKLLDPPPKVTCTRRSESGSSLSYSHRL